MEINEVTSNSEQINEAIESIEEIIQRLASLHVSMQILAEHCRVIKTLSTDEFKTLKITESELWKCWDKVQNGKNLHILTEDLANHTSQELSFLIYVALEEVKEALQNINKFPKDII